MLLVREGNNEQVDVVARNHCLEVGVFADSPAFREQAGALQRAGIVDHDLMPSDICEALHVEIGYEARAEHGDSYGLHVWVSWGQDIAEGVAIQLYCRIGSSKWFGATNKLPWVVPPGDTRLSSRPNSGNEIRPASARPKSSTTCRTCRPVSCANSRRKSAIPAVTQ